MRKRWLALLLSCAVAVNTCVVPAAATTVSDAAIATQQTVSAEDAENTNRLIQMKIQKHREDRMLICILPMLLPQKQIRRLYQRHIIF